jgi:hypothetical protein
MILLKLLISILYAGLNILHAKHDAWRIFDGRRIYHGINGLVHVMLVGIVLIYTKEWFFAIGLLSLRRIVFDTALNIFRGLRFDYISASTTSIIDRISYRFQKQYGYVIYYGMFFLLVLLSIIL